MSTAEHLDRIEEALRGASCRCPYTAEKSECDRCDALESLTALRASARAALSSSTKEPQ